MAERPRRISRLPKRLIYQSSMSSSKVAKKIRKDKNLYEVEIKDVDKERNLVRIHYKGYSEKFDEWRPFGEGQESYFPFVRLERMPFADSDSLDERSELFKHKPCTEVKRKLYSGRRDDVNVEVDVGQDVFMHVLGNFLQGIKEKGRTVYHLPSNRLLDAVLGLKWDERIFNTNGDFAYVIEKTTAFWLSKKSSVVEYKKLGDGKYIKSEIEDTPQVIFTFVRGDGNKIQYNQRH